MTSPRAIGRTGRRRRISTQPPVQPRRLPRPGSTRLRRLPRPGSTRLRRLPRPGSTRPRATSCPRGSSLARRPRACPSTGPLVPDPHTTAAPLPPPCCNAPWSAGCAAVVPFLRGDTCALGSVRHGDTRDRARAPGPAPRVRVLVRRYELGTTRQDTGTGGDPCVPRGPGLAPRRAQRVLRSRRRVRRGPAVDAPRMGSVRRRSLMGCVDLGNAAEDSGGDLPVVPVPRGHSVVLDGGTSGRVVWGGPLGRQGRGILAHAAPP